jgi:hypothetical protein
VLDKQQRGIRGNRIQKHSAEAELAAPPLDDDVEDEGLVNEVREDAREGDELARLGSQKAKIRSECSTTRLMSSSFLLRLHHSP